MILSISLITLGYMVIITSLSWGFTKVPVFRQKAKAAQVKFSIIIPFRNESANLLPLLKSLQALDYPHTHFEVICVDDASEDDSVFRISSFLDAQITPIPLRVIANERQTAAPKKDAITTAIAKAKHEWIITTDADCVLPKQWLERYNTYIQHHNAACIAGPVTYTNTDTFLNRFQLLDLISLQGATIGGFGLKQPFLCNGANLAYKKSLFTKVNGFKGNTNISSGDDIFLLEKAVQLAPQAIHYLKCQQAIVTTNAQHSWPALIQQRMRWAAKTSAYNSAFAKTTGAIVLLMNFSLLIVPLYILFGSLSLKAGFCIFTLKFATDILLLYTTALFFKPQRIIKSVFSSFCLYPIFSFYVALLTLWKGYQWKGRTFKK